MISCFDLIIYLRETFQMIVKSSSEKLTCCTYYIYASNIVDVLALTLPLSLTEIHAHNAKDHGNALRRCISVLVNGNINPDRSRTT